MFTSCEPLMLHLLAITCIGKLRIDNTFFVHRAISRNTEPKLELLVLIRMHFQCRFKYGDENSNIENSEKSFEIFIYCLYATHSWRWLKYVNGGMNGMEWNEINQSSLFLLLDILVFYQRR